MTQHELVPAVTANPLLQLSAGATYSLTDVLSVTRLGGGGVELVVATDDPTGRTAIVKVWPDRGDSVRTRVRFEPATGIAFVGASFASGPDEAFHGFGGRRNAVDQAGESFYNWIDQTVLAGPGTGGRRPAGTSRPSSSRRVPMGSSSSRASCRSGGCVRTVTMPGRWRATHRA